MSFEVIFIALLHAIPVFLVHKIWRNKVADWVISAVMVFVAFATGNIAFVWADLVAIGIALWSCTGDTFNVSSRKEAQLLGQASTSEPAPQNNNFLTWIIILGIGCSVFFIFSKESPVAYQSPKAAPVSEPNVPALLVQPRAIAPASVNTNITPSNSQKPSDGGEYSWNLKDIETLHPELNPDHIKFRSDLLNEAAKRLTALKKQGYTPTESLKLAVTSMERENAFIPIARSSVVTQQTATHELSIGEETTIGMACGQYQMNGDVEGYQLCSREQKNRASRGSALPTMKHLTMGEQTAINMACGDHQMIGNIEAYQSCIRTTVLKASR
jgi:hypothetical protein